MIVHLSTETGWRGGERQVALLARGLRERGWTQAAAVPVDSPLARELTQLGLTIISLPPRPLLHPLALFQLASWFRERPGAILHAHGSPSLDVAHWLSRWARAGAVIHTRRVAFQLRSSAKFRTGADRYVAISQAIADQFASIGTDGKRVVVIPSAVDFAPLDAAQPIQSPFPSHPLVVCVAQLTAEKGVAVLAAAWRSVVQRQPHARLALIGDGPQRDAVIAALGDAAATVHLAGFRDDVPSWLRAATIYVQPSLHEGLGSTVIDALACSVPALVSRTGGLPEVVDGGRCGVLVQPGDPAALADAIVGLLKDDERRATLAASGRDFARSRFAVPALIDAHERLYRDFSAVC